MSETKIELSEKEYEEVKSFCKNVKHNIHLITRAKILLSLNDMSKNRSTISQICKEHGVSRQTVYVVQKTYLKNKDIKDVLNRKKREKGPRTLVADGNTEAHVIALACSTPPEEYARWTIRLLSEKMVELNFVDEISRSTVQRILKKQNISLI